MADNDGTPDVGNTNTSSLLNTPTVTPEVTPVTPEVTPVAPVTPVATNTPMSMEDFVKTLDEGIRDSKSFSKFTNVQDLAKSYTELEKLVGAKGDIPKAEADQSEWGDFWKKLGKPENVADYNIEVPEALKAMDGSFDKVNKAMELALDADLTTSQATKLFKGLFDLEAEGIEAQTHLQSESLEVSKKKLEDAWGNAFDEMAGEVQALETRLGVFDAFEEAGLNSNPDLLIALGKLAKDLGETSTIETASSHTPQGVDMEISEINSEIKTLLKAGSKIPPHMTAKLQELFKRQIG